PADLEEGVEQVALLAGGRGGQAEGDETAGGREQRVALRPALAADGVEDEIDALAAGRAGDLGDVVARAVDRVLAAALAQEVVLGRGGDAVDLAVAGLREIDRREADAAGRRMNEHARTRAEVA